MLVLPPEFSHLFQALFYALVIFLTTWAQIKLYIPIKMIEYAGVTSNHPGDILLITAVCTGIYVIILLLILM
jgi:hypothetical protein